MKTNLQTVRGELEAYPYPMVQFKPSLISNGCHIIFAKIVKRKKYQNNIGSNRCCQITEKKENASYHENMKIQ